MRQAPVLAAGALRINRTWEHETMRDYKTRKRREPIGRALLLALVILAVMLGGACTPLGPAYDAGEPDAADWTADSHNAAGGYRDACGELPGILGDDC